MDPLPAALDALYAAFADVPKPTRIEGCPCCIEDKDVDVLLARPLRDLSSRELSAYASSAFLTVGEVADYLYFLPRILEISIKEKGWWPDIEVSGRAIAQTDPGSWPAQRLEALKAVLHAKLVSLISRDDTGWEIDDWLCAIAKAGLDVRPFLVQLQASPAHVLAFYGDNAQTLPRRKLSNAFWELPDPGHDQIVEWFASEPVADILFQAYGVVLHPS